MAEAPHFDYDVCISHPPQDEAVVRGMAETLRHWNQRGGAPLPPLIVITSEAANSAVKFRSFLNRSRSLVLVASHYGKGSALLPPEEQARRFLNPNDFDRRFVLVTIGKEFPIDAPSDVTPLSWAVGSGELTKRLYDLVRPSDRPMPASVRRRLNGVLRGHAAPIRTISLSSDGSRAASCSLDGTIRVWDVEGRACLTTFGGQLGLASVASLSSDGSRIASSAINGAVRVWDVNGYAFLATFEGQSGSAPVVSLSPDGSRAASSSLDGKVRVWDVKGHACLATLEGHSGQVWGMSLSADGSRVATGSDDGTVRVWDVGGRACLATLEGHSAPIWGVSLSADASRVASGSFDRTVRVWDVAGRACLATLEGHTDRVMSVSLSSDGSRVASGSFDGTVRIWDVEGRACLATLEGHSGQVLSVSLSADGNLAVSTSDDGLIYVWDLGDLETTEAPATATYTCAKVLLTGNSGVGKSGLAHWMVHETLVPTVSTDAVWATIVKFPEATPLPQGAEREIWLWDFAGQPDYRLNHLLYMEGTDVALQVFNPQDNDPYEGLAEWDRAITLAAGDRPFRKLLVAGRVDRGGLRVSGEAMRDFADRRGFHGYHETSAQTGQGCAELRRAILDAIPWDKLPYTASPTIFRRIKAEVVRLKDEGRRVLLRIGELESELKARMADEPFKPEEFLTVVRLLAGSGVIWLLPYEDRRSRAGADPDRWTEASRPTIDWVLLQPERINSYAAAVVREVKKHPEEIGCIAEDAVLGAGYEVPKETKLPRDEELIVLREMIGTMITRGICLKEHTTKGTLLVFPAYFRRERPEFPVHPPEFVSYGFRGVLDEVYTTLVVRLHHTEAFEKDNLYKDAADFKVPGSPLRAGLNLTRRPESRGEITVYLDHAMPMEVKVIFMQFVDDHFNAPHRASDVVRTRHYTCPACGTRVESHENVRKKLTEGKRFIRCVECDVFIELFDKIEERFGTPEIREKAREWEREAQVKIDDQSKELIMRSEVAAIVGRANQVFRSVVERDEGIDAEIEFTDVEGRGTGQRLYLQLKAGDSFLSASKTKGIERFDIKKERWVKYWQEQAYPVMLVVRTSNGVIRWMDVSAALKEKTRQEEAKIPSIEFHGEPFTIENLLKKRAEALT